MIIDRDNGTVIQLRGDRIAQIYIHPVVLDDEFVLDVPCAAAVVALAGPDSKRIITVAVCDEKTSVFQRKKMDGKATNWRLDWFGPSDAIVR